MSNTGTTPTAVSTPTVPFWIKGKAAPPRSTRQGEATNAATGEVVRKVPFANAEDVDAAVQAAAAAFPAWRATPPLRRARILMRFRDLLERHTSEIAGLVTEEHGKTLPDAAGSVQRGLEVVEFAIGVPHLLKGEHSEEVGTAVDCHTVKQPLGVCAGITPFNFPVMVPLWMFPVAIACGNTFVLKPSEKDPSPSIRLAELLKDAGLPDGVLNVVHGDKEAVDAMLVHPSVRAVSFVGSTPIAKYIYETASRQGNGSRPWEAPRTTRSCCQTRTWTRPRTPSLGRRTARRASGAWQSRQWSRSEIVVIGSLARSRRRRPA